MNTTSGAERAIFFLMAVVIIGLLSFRPIPSLTDVNDTGRYLNDFAQSCSIPAFSGWLEHPSDVSFNSIFRPLCWMGGSPRLFIFVAALAVPLAFIFFGEWGRGKLFWALGALLSVYGFEFATNALRQGLGIVFLLWAFTAILGDRHFVAIITLSIAVIVHISNIAFVPLLLFIWMRIRTDKLGAAKSAFLIIGLLISAVVVIYSVRSGSLSNGEHLYDTFAGIYADSLSLLFVIFVSLPLFYIYAVRKVTTPHQVSNTETTTMLYSSALLVLCLMLFPYIAYRFAFTCCALQTCISMRAPGSNTRQGIYVLLGMILLLVIFVSLSRYEQGVLFG